MYCSWIRFHEYIVLARIPSKQMPEATQELIMAFIMSFKITWFISFPGTSLKKYSKNLKTVMLLSVCWVNGFVMSSVYCKSQVSWTNYWTSWWSCGGWNNTETSTSMTQGSANHQWDCIVVLWSVYFIGSYLHLDTAHIVVTVPSIKTKNHNRLIFGSLGFLTCVYWTNWRREKDDLKKPPTPWKPQTDSYRKVCWWRAIFPKNHRSECDSPASLHQVDQRYRSLWICCQGLLLQICSSVIVAFLRFKILFLCF